MFDFKCNTNVKYNFVIFSYLIYYHTINLLDHVCACLIYKYVPWRLSSWNHNLVATTLLVQMLYNLELSERFICIKPIKGTNLTHFVIFRSFPNGLKGWFNICFCVWKCIRDLLFTWLPLIWIPPVQQTLKKVIYSWKWIIN